MEHQRWEGTTVGYTMRSLDRCLGHALWGMAGGIAKTMRIGTQRGSDLTKSSQLRANYRVCTWGIESYLCGAGTVVNRLSDHLSISTRRMHNNACLLLSLCSHSRFLVRYARTIHCWFAEYEWICFGSVWLYLMNMYEWLIIINYIPEVEHHS